jgi:hypothetical protein
MKCSCACAGSGRSREYRVLLVLAALVGLVVSAVAVGAPDLEHVRVAVDVAVLERKPLAGTKSRRAGEDHERPVGRSKRGRERVQLVPTLERPLFGVVALRVLDADLGGVETRRLG